MVLKEPWEFNLERFSQGLRDGCGAPHPMLIKRQAICWEDQSWAHKTFSLDDVLTYCLPA